MAILRHGDISTTMNIYAQVPNEDARRALQKIEELMEISSQKHSQLEMSPQTS
jgi:hypothetical protein